MLTDPTPSFLSVGVADPSLLWGLGANLTVSAFLPLKVGLRWVSGQLGVEVKRRTLCKGHSFGGVRTRVGQGCGWLLIVHSGHLPLSSVASLSHCRVTYRDSTSLQSPVLRSLPHPPTIITVWLRCRCLLCKFWWVTSVLVFLNNQNYKRLPEAAWWTLCGPIHEGEFPGAQVTAFHQVLSPLLEEYNIITSTNICG